MRNVEGAGDPGEERDSEFSLDMLSWGCLETWTEVSGRPLWTYRPDTDEGPGSWEGGIRTCKGAWRVSAVVCSEEQWSEARTPRQPTVEWPNRWGSPLETRDVRRSQESVESWKSQEACSRRGSGSSVWFCWQGLRSTFGVAQQELSQLRGDEAGSRLKNWEGAAA